MLYESTRGGLKSLTSVEVIKQGIAPDGGLFVPEQGVQFPLDAIKKTCPTGLPPAGRGDTQTLSG